MGEGWPLATQSQFRDFFPHVYPTLPLDRDFQGGGDLSQGLRTICPTCSTCGPQVRSEGSRWERPVEARGSLHSGFQASVPHGHVTKPHKGDATPICPPHGTVVLAEMKY